MDESANSKRLILATGLCLVVMVLGQIFMPPKKAAGPNGEGSAQDAMVAGEGARTSTLSGARTGERSDERRAGRAGVDDGTGNGGANGEGEVLDEPPVEAATFLFQGEVPGDAGAAAIPFEVALTNMGGGIDSFRLLTYRERNSKNQPSDLPIQLANSIAGMQGREAAIQQMAGVEFTEGTSFRTPALIPYKVVESTADRVVYQYRSPDGVEIEREYSFRKDSFEVELAVTVRNESPKTQRHNMRISTALHTTDAMKKGSGFLANFIPPGDHLDALCFNDESVTRVAHQTLVGETDGRHEDNGVRWVAADRQYFVAAIVLRDRAEAACRLKAEGPILRASLEMPEVVLEPGQEKRHKFTAYLGVKKPALLTLMDAQVEGAVDYRILGMNLAPLCAALLWILGMVHRLSGSWGIAILGLTVLVKLVLFPLNQRSGRSMRALSQLKPAMEAIKAKFPEDRQRQSEELMKLYREHGVNPAGGCLPILIQMPIWFALYRALWSSVDLYQQGFLWLNDLTTPDPYWVLPVLLIVVMFLQQRMTPSTMDAAQQKIMQYTMPLVFGAMMIALPSGLCFYILINTLLTIVQQHLINKSVGPVGGSQSAQGAAA
ncbi:MAG: membrane protein insertase YidC [Deltaproteobacteria bacterium]|nr:membrane protein insertase YidC [Deltaproteobacteria bacterium]